MRLALRALLVLSLSILAPCSATLAQNSDTHLTIDPAAKIYQRSTFLHGYAHGYELGFHSGDLDLHMGRNARDPRSLKLFKDSKKAFQKQFGNRDMFVNGYEQGFRVGYADSYFGREFRAAQEVRSLSQQLRDGGAADGKPQADPEFDKGMSEGYKKGLSTGLFDARGGSAFHPANSQCPKKDAAGDYCQAHSMGYELGYSDGYNNLRKPEEGVKTARE